MQFLNFTKNKVKNTSVNSNFLSTQDKTVFKLVITLLVHQWNHRHLSDESVYFFRYNQLKIRGLCFLLSYTRICLKLFVFYLSLFIYSILCCIFKFIYPGRHSWMLKYSFLWNLHEKLDLSSTSIQHHHVVFYQSFHIRSFHIVLIWLYQISIHFLPLNFINIYEYKLKENIILDHSIRAVSEIEK